MTEDDKVGYGRPPRHTRFKPGQSGNPRGRPKAARGLKTNLETELGARMTIQINGEPVTASKLELALKTLTTRAAAGDLKAIRAVLDLIMQVLGPGDADKGREQLSPGDQAILAQILGEQEPAASADQNDEAATDSKQGKGSDQDED
jgi:hypothetical protein